MLLRRMRTRNRLAKQGETAAGAAVRRARLALAVILTGVVLALSVPAPASADKMADDFMATLDARSRGLFEDWLSAVAFHEFELDAYWKDVNDKRSVRRARKSRSEELTVDDYVSRFPPEFKGSALPPELQKAWADFQARNAPPVPPVEPPKPVATVPDFLAAASQSYGFEPQRIAEREFKLRYAREALRIGLTKDQVVRIYALETSGIGTADMQAGIHPVKRTGTAISTALGYAQLLAANSTDETAKHGLDFMSRLKEMADEPGIDAGRRKQLNAKIASLRRMVVAARTVANGWEAHVAFGSTPKGMGIHALNIDGDVGPMLQAVKLKGLKDLADKQGRTRLAGNEIELMNLAGPGTGLEMMAGVARNMPTPNFFSRAAYARNTIVRGKTAAELLLALDKRMDENIGNPGAIEFADAFDQAMREAGSGR